MGCEDPLGGIPKEVLTLRPGLTFYPMYVEVGINGHKASMFIDTGAPITYMPKEIVEQYPQVSTGRDFFATYGFFDIDIHEIPIRLGGEQLTFRVAYLPDDLEILPYILGSEIFRYCTVQFRFPEMKVCLI